MAEIEAVKLKLSSKINKKAPVFLANFSCGKLNNQKIKFDCFKSQDDSDKDDRTARRILAASGGHLTHSGSSKDCNQNSPIRYFIGVRNKSGKMKLYDSKNFHLKPDLPELVPKIDETNITSDYWESRNTLTAAFGAKVSKRALSLRLKLAVNDKNDDSFQEELNESLTSKPLDELPSESNATASYLPPINRDASNIEEVFNINDIISPEEDSALDEYVQEWLQQYQTDPESATTGVCKFVYSNIRNSLHDIKKLKLMLYYNSMHTFHRLKIAEVRKKQPTDLIPLVLTQHLIKKFTTFSKDTSGKQMISIPPQMKDKILAYMIVVALFINDYCVNANNFLHDLVKVGIKRFLTLAQTLGCHISTQKVNGESVKFAQLKLPLNFIPTKFSKRQF